jgi:hypothetical protein
MIMDLFSLLFRYLDLDLRDFVYLSLGNSDEKVTCELMSVCCPLLCREVDAANGGGKFAATRLHLLFTTIAGKSTWTLATHFLKHLFYFKKCCGAATC